MVDSKDTKSGLSVAKSHWEQVYSQKADNETSWHQETPEVSLALISSLVSQLDKPRVLDVGGGTSNLISNLLSDNLISAGAVLDISESAIERNKQKSGQLADSIEWYVGDVTEFECCEPFDIWHDRAVLHFLTESAAQKSYVDRLNHALKCNGYAVIATFAVGGPEKCSGLTIQQYDESRIKQLLGDNYTLINSLTHEHHTPWNSAQLFHYFVLQKTR